MQSQRHTPVRSAAAPPVLLPLNQHPVGDDLYYKTGARFLLDRAPPFARSSAKTGGSLKFSMGQFNFSLRAQLGL